MVGQKLDKTVAREHRELLWGVNPVLEKLKAAPSEMAEIMLSQESQRAALVAIENEGRRLGVRITRQPSQLLDQVAQGQKHQGVLAWMRPYAYLSLAELEERLKASPGEYWVLVLDGLTDPRNFGALLRTADAVGVKDIVIPKDRAVGITPVVVKASAGAIHHLRICRVTNLRSAIATLKNHGLWVVGLESTSPVALYSQHYPARLAVILGSEGRGIRPLIQRECDFLVSVPMRGKIASLNVSVAGAVFLYELLRQKVSVDKAGGKS